VYSIPLDHTLDVMKQCGMGREFQNLGKWRLVDYDNQTSVRKQSSYAVIYLYIFIAAQVGGLLSA